MKLLASVAFIRSVRQVLLPLALVALIVALVAPLACEREARERARIDDPSRKAGVDDEEHEFENSGHVRADRPGEAMAFRSLSLRSDTGVIPADGLMRARAQATAMKDRLLNESFSALSIPLTRAGWTWIGPGNVGGRVRALLAHPTRIGTLFAGSVSGGIWTSTNGGASWAPVDDFMANLAVTSMVFHPTNPQIMYAATGEGFSNADAIRGAGIFKSTDGGQTWGQLASTNSASFHYVLRIAMSPDGRTLLAATTSGLYRSTDAGATWTKSPTVPGTSDVDFHPTDSRRAIAGCRSGRAWYSRDGGATWTQALLTLPATTSGSHRVEVAYAKGTPDVVYAVVDRNAGVMFRSIDGGATFVESFRSDTVRLLENGQGWYDLALWVNPRDANDVIVGGVNLYRSRDGAQSFTQISTPNGPLHVDQHVIIEHPRFDNATNRVLFIGNDGGVYRVPDIATLISPTTSTYEELNNNLGITQFYGASGNPATGVIVGGTQDNGTLVFSPGGGSEAWDAMFGGDGGFSAADPSHPSYLYGEYIYLQLHRSTNGGRTAHFIYSGLPDAGRHANFIAPFVLDPNRPQRMLAGGLNLWRSNDVRATTPVWQSIKSGSGSNYISAIAVAPGNPNIIWVGHNNGDLYRTTNGTAATPMWTRMDPSTFPNRFLTRITIDPLDHNVVYASFGGFADRNIQRTDDGGAAWTDATGTGTTGLPFAPVRDVEIDPTDSNVIWAGTEVGIFTSRDRGLTWDVTHDGPANVSVDELFVLNDYLYAVTHGRGLFRHALTEDSGTPAVSITPSARTFSSTYVGNRSAGAAVTVVSAGTGSVTINEVRVTGLHAADFLVTADACSGQRLASAESCVVHLAFQPRAAGLREAAISIGSSAPGSPHTAMLSGSGLLAPASPAALPAPWTTRDIGVVGGAGSVTVSGGTFTVHGGGQDVWGTADGFRYVYQTLNGDGDIVARVASVQNLQAWVKAGVMIRQNTSAGSPHAFMIVSPGKGLAFQRRQLAGGITTHTAGGTGTAPAWVKLTRRGGTLTASRSDDGSRWTVVGQDAITFSGSVLIGLAVSGHDATRTASAVFDNVSVTAPGSGPLPTGWAARDVGAVGALGASSESGGLFTIRGAGADIWDTADAFRFVYRSLSGNGSIVARIASINGTASWTKAGVMIRGDAHPSSAHALMLVSTAKGLAFQRRTIDGGLSTHTSGGTGTAPRWVRLVRAGNVITASVSSDGTTWRVVGSDTIALPGTLLVGLAVSSHDTTQLATAGFDNVRVEVSR